MRHMAQRAAAGEDRNRSHPRSAWTPSTSFQKPSRVGWRHWL